MKESDFQKSVIDELEDRFPGCIILKNDPSYCQGIPDLIILWGDRWATLECKKSEDAHHQPNQDYYVEMMDKISFSAFIYPENRKKILDDLERTFKGPYMRRYLMSTQSGILIWNDHPEIPEGSHAFLSASKYAWLNYSEEKLKATYLNHLATLKGTEQHEFASVCIKKRQKLLDVPLTLNMFVNDSIDYHMRSEQKLKYSDLCYGTADSIGLQEDLMLLRIFDLKTGTHKASMPQLEVYAGLFCLEYHFNPMDLGGFELRIYQNNDKVIYSPKRERIIEVMDKIITDDRILQEVDTEGGL